MNYRPKRPYTRHSADFAPGETWTRKADGIAFDITQITEPDNARPARVTLQSGAKVVIIYASELKRLFTPGGTIKPAPETEIRKGQIWKRRRKLETVAVEEIRGSRITVTGGPFHTRKTLTESELRKDYNLIYPEHKRTKK